MLRKTQAWSTKEVTVNSRAILAWLRSQNQEVAAGRQQYWKAMKNVEYRWMQINQNARVADQESWGLTVYLDLKSRKDERVDDQER